VGISEIYVIYTDPLLKERGLDIGITSASGALQWIDIHYFTELAPAFEAIRLKYDHVYGTVIKEDSKDLYDLNLSESSALLFGNEHSGISEEGQKYIDSNFVIPQHGFVQSLNISVACAVTLYEARRQRLTNKKYNREFGGDNRDLSLNEKYLEVHRNKKLVKADKKVYL